MLNVWFHKKFPLNWRLLFSIVCIVGLFLYSVKIRSPYFGVLFEEGHHWLSASTIKFATNWYREGILPLKFLMLESPASIEFPDLLSRGPYVSYPGGAPFQLYILSLFAGNEPSASMVMGLNLAHHLAISLTIFGILWGLLSQESPLLRMVASLGGVTLYLFNHVSLYYHQNVFFADQAVIIFFALTVFLELLRDRSYFSSGWVNATQCAVIFAGCLTDWLMFFVVMALILKRTVGMFMYREKFSLQLVTRSFLPLFVSSGVALTVFVFHIFYTGTFSILWERFLLRAAVSAQGIEEVGDFYESFWRNSLGIKETKIFLFSLFVVTMSLALCLFKRDIKDHIKQMVQISLIILLPCLLQVYFFKNHSVIHDFSRLKFYFAFSIVPFFVLPFMIKNSFSYFFISDTKHPSRTMKGIYAVVCIGLSVFSATEVKRILKNSVRQRICYNFTESTCAPVANVLRATTDINTVVFSPDMEIPELPPQLVALSMKRVYRVEEMSDIVRFLDEKICTQKATLKIVLMDKTDHPFYEQIRDIALNSKKYKGFSLVEIKDPRF